MLLVDMLCLTHKISDKLVRYEWLSQYYWSDLDEVREFSTQWMWRYNHERPNMALGGITPKQRLAMAA